jgi:hypothetical protein
MKPRAIPITTAKKVVLEGKATRARVFRGLLRHLICLLIDTVLDLRTVPTQSLQELDNLGDFCSLGIASSTVRAMICVMMFAFGFGLLTPVSGEVSALADLIGAVRCEPQEGVGPGGLSKTSTLRRTARTTPLISASVSTRSKTTTPRSAEKTKSKSLSALIRTEDQSQGPPLPTRPSRSSARSNRR